VAAIGTLELRGPAGEPVDFRRLLASHGVAALVPNRIDEERWIFETTLELDGRAHTLRVTEVEPELAQIEALTALRSAKAKQRTLTILRRLFRLDEDLSGFYAAAEKDPKLAWITAGAGRMLRSPTVFEDVVKTICTTNCAWSATVRMTGAIVSELGTTAADGRRAFPSPVTMAEAPTAFYAETARTGYRGAYLRKLAAEVAEGRLDLEQLSDPEIPDDEVEQRLLALPGVGPYAAAHIMLTSLGRYGRLILDSWTRPKYARLSGRPAADEAIRRRFRRYRQYAGLAFWMMLTRDWVED
jgi:N-glycosylase/DNA lyase